MDQSLIPSSREPWITDYGGFVYKFIFHVTELSLLQSNMYLKYCSVLTSI
jgi:hypothetical protein